MALLSPFVTFALLFKKMETLKEKTAKGIFWSSINNGATQLLNIIIGIVLARLLVPEDYGIVGVLTIFTVIAGNIQASGFSQAIINIKNPTANDYNSVFWFNVIAGILSYVILFCCAPLIADYFNQPVLVDVSRVTFLVIPLSAFGIMHNVYLIKNMMNKEIAIVGITALVISGVVGIACAYNGWSYWSLVFQQLTYTVMLNIGRLCFVKWHPTFQIDFGPVRRMFPFSVKILFTNIINSLSQHILTFIFGPLFPIKSIGYYTQANNWNTKAHSFVTNTIGQIAQPVFVSVGNERERSQRVFRKMLRFAALIAFPLMFGLAMVAHEFIILLLGEKWEGSVDLLRILCVSGAFMPFYMLYQQLTISKGRSDIYLWCNVAQILLQIGVILLFAPYGMTTMVAAYTTYTILWLAVWQTVARKLIGIRFTAVLRDITPLLLTSVIIMTATYLATSFITSLHLLLPLRIITAVLLYALAIRFVDKEMWEEAMAFVKKKK